MSEKIPTGLIRRLIDLVDKHGNEVMCSALAEAIDLASSAKASRKPGRRKGSDTHPAPELVKKVAKLRLENDPAELSYRAAVIGVVEEAENKKPATEAYKGDPIQRLYAQGQRGGLATKDVAIKLEARVKLRHFREDYFENPDREEDLLTNRKPVLEAQIEFWQPQVDAIAKALGNELKNNMKFEGLAEGLEDTVRIVEIIQRTVNERVGELPLRYAKQVVTSVETAESQRPVDESTVEYLLEFLGITS